MFTRNLRNRQNVSMKNSKNYSSLILSHCGGNEIPKDTNQRSSTSA